MTADLAPLLSIVAPVYNEAGIVDELVRRLHGALGEVGSYELVIVDDSSTDETWERLLALAATDPRLRLVRLSRNFGHQVALTAGMDAARGDAIVTLDGDLQDPPELIPTLVARWREGYDVVYAVRTEREGESFFKRGTAAGFYWLLRKVAHVEIPAQAGDFRLLSRRASRALAQMPERARFLRGMSSWIGYRQIGVPYRRDARHTGDTKYPPRKMVRFATDAIFHAIRLEPYLVATARVHRDLAPRLETLLNTTRTTKRVLVHGDFSPKNILNQRKKPRQSW